MPDNPSDKPTCSYLPLPPYKLNITFVTQSRSTLFIRVKRSSISCHPAPWDRTTKPPSHRTGRVLLLFVGKWQVECKVGVDWTGARVIIRLGTRQPWCGFDPRSYGIFISHSYQLIIQLMWQICYCTTHTCSSCTLTSQHSYKLRYPIFSFSLTIKTQLCR